MRRLLIAFPAAAAALAILGLIGLAYAQNVCTVTCTLPLSSIANAQTFVVIVPPPLCQAADQGTLDMSNGCMLPGGLL
jgi:hypothetical protein